MPRVIRVGDGSGHGGNIVTAGAPRTRIGGIPVAYVGSPVTGDPVPHGPNEIAAQTGRNITKVGGYSVAVQGSVTACGASMIASCTKTRLE